MHDAGFSRSDKFSGSTTKDSTSGKYRRQVWFHPDCQSRPAQKQRTESRGHGRRPRPQVAPNRFRDRDQIPMDFDGGSEVFRRTSPRMEWIYGDCFRGKELPNVGSGSFAVHQPSTVKPHRNQILSSFCSRRMQEAATTVHHDVRSTAFY